MGELPTGFVLIFLLPFHIAGGAAIGVALRRVTQDGFGCSGFLQNTFLLLWGALFGGLPLVFGTSLEPNWFFPLQLGAFLGSIVLVALFYDWLRDLYSQPGMFVASFGFTFFMVGLAVATLLSGNGDVSELLIGGIFAGVGGALALVGVWMLMRSNR